MSWLARSIANSLKIEDDDHDDDQSELNTNTNAAADQIPHNESPRGVKEDISELTKSLTRQFWGVASFLAPHPDQIPNPTPGPSDHNNASDEEDVISGIRSDFAEIGGKFKTGISKLSSHKTVSEITKIASNFLGQIGSEEDEHAVGVTEEVLVFARSISMHPETWLDFPLDEDSDDFELSDVQQEHALAVERLAPRLSALRIELCPGYMSEACFWKIYFLLVHPRLNKHDSQLLSTPQIVEARTKLSQELQNQNKAKQASDFSGRGTIYSNETADLTHEEHLSVPTTAQSESVPFQKSTIEAALSSASADFEMEKHRVQSTELKIVDKPIVEEGPVNQTKYEHSPSGSSSRVLDEKYEDDGDDWLKEESSEMVGVSGATLPIGNDDDVSFSDLEDDDEDVPTNDQKVTSGSGSDSSTKDSRDWVQLSESSANSVKDINSVEISRAGSEQVSARNPENKESNDWLNVDDIDVI